MQQVRTFCFLLRHSMHEVVDLIDLGWVLGFDACGCITPFEAIALASRIPFLRRRDFDALSPASEGQKKSFATLASCMGPSELLSAVPKCGQNLLRKFWDRDKGDAIDACLLRQYGLDCLAGVFRLCKVTIGLDREGARDGIPQNRKSRVFKIRYLCKKSSTARARTTTIHGRASGIFPRGKSVK